MTDATDRDDETHGIRSSLLRPFHIAATLAALGLIVSIAFLAYMSWSSRQRLDPLERHLNHLHALQESSLGIQELLIRHIEDRSPPTDAEIAGISDRLQKILDNGGHLNEQTPENLRQARQFLEANNGNPEAGLLAALTIVRQTVAEENELQRLAILETRKAAESEFLVAGMALFLAPLASVLMLAQLRRRSLGSLQKLSVMLENVGNLDFRSIDPSGPGDPLAPVFARYNAMTEKLREARDATNRQQETLEAQVRVSAETLLRQQIELADAARLSALGEFSAQVAHELRNPISGIGLALRNLEGEVADADQKERLGLVIDEMDRVSRLLNELLERRPGRPEAPAPVDLRGLVDDMARLFRFGLPARSRIDVVTDIAAETCRLPRDTLRQVLLNLMRNAAEAIGGNPGRIGISAHRAGGEIVLAVTDDGPGYPPDLLRFGVRPFQSGKERGTGLGLAVIQRQIRSAGGELRLECAKGGGARAVISLPCPA
ncbi:MAG: ATP-binding protein [Hyphomicrobiales bacterium]